MLNGDFLLLVCGLDEAFELIRPSGLLAELLDGVQLLACNGFSNTSIYGLKSYQLTLPGTVHGPDFVLLELSQVFERRGLGWLLSRLSRNFLTFMHKVVRASCPGDLHSEDM